MNEPVTLKNNSELLAAVPASLGFTPEASIIVLLLHDVDGHTELRNSLRFNISTEAAAGLTTTAAPAFRGITHAILIAVCGDWIADHAAQALDIVRDSLRALDITIMVRLHTRSFEQPGQWTDIDTGERGPILPFKDSPVTADQVFRGRRIAANRDEIIAEFTPATNPVPIVTGDSIEIIVPTCETIAAITTGTTKAELHPDLATRTGIVITHNVNTRDALLLLCADHPGPAAALWTRLANQLTGAARLEALTIAAICYYLASDTIRTGIALDIAADEANAAHLDYPRLAVLVNATLQAGVAPTKVHDLLAAIVDRARPQH